MNLIPNNHLCVVVTTFPNLEVARATVRVLVEEDVIACGTVVPGSESTYRWEGKIVSEAEVLGLLKVRKEQLDPLAARFAALHPYSVPEFLVLNPEQGNEAYLRWASGDAQ
jgi:periplasmic divalent cation tolerance protein